ncbi:glutathione S-transferase [Cordyceps fumosorosea ARSEF 2679]|uniref:Glutathione S-transferase n=1 Tax=Cordyceps fumosorosea (strain ARSEF 2679) TaxID=1081104 RepID=A0A167R5X4_CORFA|nr:glutathione S-transferase [Cordyceps fumosorosea ARSEF 2679]OAA58299.1 glutathione S-transferase [Cordyceps fumosorosea ARSEF 2679]
MSLIKFYRADYSTAGITDAVLRELEAAAGHPLAERIDVALRTGTRDPSFLAVNPNGFVPALVLPDGEPLWESVAITAYLGETHGVAAGLWPAATEVVRRAQALKWIAWSNVNLPLHARAIGRVLHGEKEAEEGVQRVREADAEKAKGELRTLLAVLDGGLEGREYLLKEGYSLADTHIWAFMSYVKMLGVDWESLGNLKAWVDRVGAREQLKGL